MGKHFFQIIVVFLLLPVVAGCSTNPATGENQFTALMSPAQETQVGAQEHAKVLTQYTLYEDQTLQRYIQDVGRKVVQNTERNDVTYQFFLLDSPVVNAFALPGGYIYLTRGLLALSNSEAEMAAVLAHEAGHITARHSAERFSRGVVTSIGAAILASAIGDSSVSQVLGTGTDLYMKSYSRGQENQADSLGIRYLSRNGYDPRAMSEFLSSLQADTQMEAILAGESASAVGTTDYFSTHPATAERVSLAMGQAGQYPLSGTIERDSYLRRLDGLVYGDSAKQGFIRGQDFYHPDMGFAFLVPRDYKAVNQPHQVVATNTSGAAIVFDMATNPQRLSPMDFLRVQWAQGEPVNEAEDLDINGMRAATATFDGAVNGKPMMIRLIAIEWDSGKIARFLMAMPRGLSASDIESLQRTTYSFRRLSAQERKTIRPYRIKIISAKAGDTLASLAHHMVFTDYKQERFRVLNGLQAGEDIKAGNLYKVVTD
jgi:predicted Zn-dependent protease